MITGLINRAEIWDKSRWADYNADDNMDEIAEQMLALGFSI